MAATAAGGGAARIGPNALTQPFAVLAQRRGEAFAAALLEATTDLAAGRLPDAMVEETLVARFQHGITDALGWHDGFAVLDAAGERTAAYLLAHRIPGPVQRLLRWLPRRLALRVLARAITRHSWTFAGSGRFAFVGDGRTPFAFEIGDCPMAAGFTAPEPACRFYAAVFRTLLRTLVAPAADVVETRCMSVGDPVCRFEIRGV